MKGLLLTRALRATLALLLLLSLAACGDDSGTTTDEDSSDEDTTDETAEAPQLTVEATDFAFDISDGATAGVTEVVLTNSGEEPHHVQLARLNESVTAEQFQQEMQNAGEAALRLVTLVGGAMTAGPGGESSALVNLEEGTHVALCFISGQDGVPHVGKGMVAVFEVAAAEGETAEAPQADATVQLLDFTFEIPELQAGEQVIAFENQGPQPHEAAIIPVPEGQEEAVDAYLEGGQEGPPPFEANPIGGVQGLSKGETSWAELDLQPGSYVFLCFIPDPESGKPHAQLGMAKRVTVTG